MPCNNNKPNRSKNHNSCRFISIPEFDILPFKSQALIMELKLIIIIFYCFKHAMTSSYMNKYSLIVRNRKQCIKLG